MGLIEQNGATVRKTVYENRKRLKLGLSPEMINLAIKLNTPEKISDYLKTKIYEPENVLHNPEDAICSKRLHCFDGAFLGYTLGLLNSMDMRMVYLEGIDDNDHMIVIFKEKGRYGAFSQSSNPLMLWRKPEYATVKDLVASFRNVYHLHGAPRFSDMVGYSEEIDEEFFNREKIGFDWITSMDKYKNLFHVTTNKLKYRLLEEIDSGVDRQFSHPLIIALQFGWITMVEEADEYQLDTSKFEPDAKRLFDEFLFLTEKLKPADDDTAARNILIEFFNLTGTTPPDLINMTSYLNGQFRQDGFRKEQLLN